MVVTTHAHHAVRRQTGSVRHLGANVAESGAAQRLVERRSGRSRTFHRFRHGLGQLIEGLDLLRLNRQFPQRSQTVTNAFSTRLRARQVDCVPEDLHHQK